MKTTSQKIRRTFITAAAIFFAAPLAAQAALQVNYPDGSECQTLIAGQHIEAGEVCVEVQGTTLAVTYNMFDNWELMEAHLWAGTNLLDMPANKKGNPKIGNFPYVTGDITGATTITFNVSLEEAFGAVEPCDVTGLLAGHAAVRRDNGEGGYETQTGWIDGEQIIEKGSWAMFSSVEFTCPVDEEVVIPVIQCKGDTAYAYASGDPAYIPGDYNIPGGATFIDLGITSARWGWQITLNDGDVFDTPIYAGAGQNDLSKGYIVGKLNGSYLNGELSVTYLMNDGSTMKELHLYVGEDDLPSLAPGSYTVVKDGLTGGEETTFTYTSFETAPSINVVAHAATETCTAE